MPVCGDADTYLKTVYSCVDMRVMQDEVIDRIVTAQNIFTNDSKLHTVIDQKIHIEKTSLRNDFHQSQPKYDTKKSKSETTENLSTTVIVTNVNNRTARIEDNIIEDILANVSEEQWNVLSEKVDVDVLPMESSNKRGSSNMLVNFLLMQKSSLMIIIIIIVVILLILCVTITLILLHKKYNHQIKDRQPTDRVNISLKDQELIPLPEPTLFSITETNEDLCHLSKSHETQELKNTRTMTRNKSDLILKFEVTPSNWNFDRVLEY